ncbi:flagellar assembly protein FliW [Gracilibacillus alcaliphilus]|uniref:flagellar assembly protein FliW n=1 Tax=Gracilibacillus alcaliphilus TaxID=1401441 RepID=UPI00195E6380|nr:flagellar assembly protein FliW [Gracilibacillus alcaliphilus]MBM7676029.1 flagellar assembly factor FliW [Gracilibacillus alcaliphilus]
MQIRTKYFGETEINPEETIHFSQGLPGFLQEKQFVLLGLEENGFFQVLQSTVTEQLAFVVVNPFLFVEDYQLQLEDTVLEQLAIKHEQDVMVLAIVTVKDPLACSTANLQAPIVINHTNKRAKQYIIKSQHYTPRETIFQQAEKKEVE